MIHDQERADAPTARAKIEPIPAADTALAEVEAERAAE
jgi:hypothetical protein